MPTCRRSGTVGCFPIASTRRCARLFMATPAACAAPPGCGHPRAEAVMPTWDPRQYLKFADHRLRPALDLLAQIPLEAPAAVYDLGCGPGNITRLLAERWPAARVTGIDSSPEMLTKARQEAPAIAFAQADIARWAAPAPVDLLFSNSTLQWLEDHTTLFPRLLGQLAPGGVLAVQMPHNHDAPSHVLMRAAAEAGPWWP